MSQTGRHAKDIWTGLEPLDVLTLAVDLGNLTELDQMMEPIWARTRAEGYTRALLFHNAGSVGELTFTQDWTSVENLRQYNDFNVTSMMWLSKRFLELFGAPRDDQSTVDQVPKYFGRNDPRNDSASGKNQPWSACTSVIVNVSSLCASEPFHCMNMYCTGKAARKMHMRMIAKEQSHSNVLRTLSYSPGPMNTEMQREIRDTETHYKPTREFFAQMLREVRWFLTISFRITADM